MLFFAAQEAIARGWDVRQVWWEVPLFNSDAEEVAWVGSQLDAALDGYAGRVIGDSDPYFSQDVLDACQVSASGMWVISPAVG